MSYNLYVDDERNPKSEIDFIVVRSYNEAIEYINTNGIPGYISFDHDLGSDKTGYDLAKWLGDKVISDAAVMFRYFVHSANPVGAENINKYLEFISNYIR